LLAIAEIIATWLPSTTESSTAITSKDTNDAPTGITTDDGTVAADRSLLERLTIIEEVVGVFRVTIALDLPFFSDTDIGESETPSVGISSSTTTIGTVPLENPVADAVIVTCWLPSAKESLVAIAKNIIEFAPAGMVTEFGTVAAVVSLLRSVTTSDCAVGVFRVTVIVDVPSNSEIESLEAVRLSDGDSLSTIVTVAAPVAKFAALADTVACRLPLAIVSSINIIVNVVELSPTGIVTEFGTDATPGKLLPKFIVSATLVGVFRVTVAVVEPLSSRTKLFVSDTRSVATSSSSTINCADPAWKLAADAVIVET